MDVSKLSRLSFILLISFAADTYATTCQELINKLPFISSDNPFIDTLNARREDCKQRASSDTPEALQECIKYGMSSLAFAGNYVAQIEMAKIECQAGNDLISKNWLSLILNNNNASPEIKAVAQEAADSKNE